MWRLWTPHLDLRFTRSQRLGGSLKTGQKPRWRGNLHPSPTFFRMWRLWTAHFNAQPPIFQRLERLRTTNILRIFQKWRLNRFILRYESIEAVIFEPVVPPRGLHEAQEAPKQVPKISYFVIASNNQKLKIGRSSPFFFVRLFGHKALGFSHSFSNEKDVRKNESNVPGP